MQKVTDQELVQTLLQASEEDRINWQPTGLVEQFSASFGGKWTVIIDKSTSQQGDFFFIRVKNSEGEEVVTLTSHENAHIGDLYEMARRSALKIDEQLKGLLNEIQKQKK